MDLKPIRVSMQETMEDDATKRGSAARFVMIVGMITLCTSLIFALSVHVFMRYDMAKIINQLAYMIGGGHVAYLTGKVTGIFGDHDAPKEDGDPK